jgi:hypothetical protein
MFFDKMIIVGRFANTVVNLGVEVVHRSGNAARRHVL